MVRRLKNTACAYIVCQLPPLNCRLHYPQRFESQLNGEYLFAVIEIQIKQLRDAFQSVKQSISVYEQISGSVYGILTIFKIYFQRFHQIGIVSHIVIEERLESLCQS